jgi:quercetin dioxygenase-like cupin family protein
MKQQKILRMVVACMVVAVSILMPFILTSCNQALVISETQQIRVWTIENDADGIPRAQRGAELTYTKVADSLKQESDGLKAPLAACGLVSLENPSVSVLMYTIRPNGTVATHGGPGAGVYYILQGKGRLTLKGAEPIDYAPNDCFVLKSGVLHGFENGGEVTVMLVVKVP